jgi:DNA-binding winged helix-turn-helix (wHTH) protein
MAYRFGPFFYDPVSRGLLHGGVEIALTHKSRELLVLFLHNPGRLLTREQIIEKVWPDVAVTDDALRFQLTELRKAFGEEGSEFIRTIRREGYRWEAPVRAAADRPVRVAADDTGQRHAPRFRLVLETREVQLLDGENVVGRDADAALWIDNPSVSRHHARVVVAHDKVTLEDLESKNGTFVGEARVTGPTILADGDAVRLGLVKLIFRSAAGTHSTTKTVR